MSGSPSTGPERAQAADELLAQSQQLIARDASERTDTWHRLRGRVLGLQAPRSKKAWRVQWRRVGLVAASVAMGGLLLSTAGRRRPVVSSTASQRTPVSAQSTADETRAARTGQQSRDEARGPRDGWQDVDLHAVGHLLAAPNAAFRLPSSTSSEKDSSYTVVLDSGELCAQVAHRDLATQGPFVVQAPAMRAVVVGTRFCIFAGRTLADSWVMVEEGKVRVERAGGESRLAGAGAVVRAAGESFSASGDVTTPAAASAEATHEVTAPGARPSASAVRSICPAAPLQLRERCLWRQAGGAGLAAQNALYLLGAMARDQQHDGGAALSIWRTYQHRFPQGALSAETAWNVFDELVAEHRFDEALASSEDFVKQHGDFFRAGELQLRRADVLEEALGRPGEAEAEYEQVLSRESRAALRDEALFGLGRCEKRLNRPADARATFELYRKEFPRGKHRAEVSRWLEAQNDGH